MGGLIIGFDPSSTVCGYAVAEPGGKLLGAGLITPEDRYAGSFERVVQIGDQVESLLAEVSPGVILIEWTKGKVGKRHSGCGAGLAVYGCGVGAVGDRCWLWARGRPVAVEAILENDWTRGVPKGVRSVAIEQLYPELQPVADPGGDVHDAVGLVEWWRRRRLCEMA